MSSSRTVERRRSPALLASSALIVCLLLTMVSAPSFAEETTNITADLLEYDKEAATFKAKGKVKVQRGEAVIETDEINYNEQTSEAVAEKELLYEDTRVRIKAKRARLNLDEKTGKLFEAEILSKKDNYHITGKEISKESEERYTVRDATFTTCDAPVPAWCFKSKEVDVVVGDRLKATGATLNINNMPLFFTPYWSSALDRERKTGFLFPGVGYIESKGFHAEQPFFWALADNRDLTIILDIYTNGGIGQGFEYRFMELDGSKGDFYVYHIKDKDSDSDFWGLRGLYDRDRDKKITGYLSLNYVNSKDFYDQYVPYIMNQGKKYLDSASYLTTTTERFLTSAGEGSVRFDNSRLFLNAYYYVDLKGGIDSSATIQRIPEIGYVINPMRIGPVLFSFSSLLSYFWNQEDMRATRIDIYPRFTYAFGSDITVSQSLGLRETAYKLSDSMSSDSSPHRESLDYTIVAHTRLMKRYSSFSHIVEPSLGYTFISPSDSNLPLLDSTELYGKTSLAEFSLLNRFLDSKGEFLTVRISEAYDINRDEDQLLPLKVEAALQRPVNLRGTALFNLNTGKIEGINSDISISMLPKATLSIGERYKRADDILFFSLGAQYEVSKELSAEGIVWYDAKGEGLKSFIAKLKYQKQCWGFTAVFTKNEEDYSINLLIDLLGLGTFKI